MALLNYHPQFAPLVESGQKRMTIRAQRKRPIVTGETLHHYSGCRTKHARRLMEPVPCKRALDIVICWKQQPGSKYRSLEVRKQFKGKLNRSEIEQLALDDGHASVEAFQAWFLKDGITEFSGQLIEW